MRVVYQRGPAALDEEGLDIAGSAIITDDRTAWIVNYSSWAGYSYLDISQQACPKPDMTEAEWRTWLCSMPTAVPRPIYQLVNDPRAEELWEELLEEPLLALTELVL